MMFILPGIYRFINNVSGKVYVGSSARCIIKRAKSHIRELRKGDHGNRRFQRAWTKYGEDAFEFEVVEIISPLRPNFEEYVIRREQFYLDITPSCVRMNICPEARLPYRAERSDAFKKNVGDNFRGKPLSTVHKEKLSRINKGQGIGRKLSKEICEKMSASRRGRKLSEAHCEATSKGRRGIVFSTTHRRNLQLGQHIRYIRERAAKRTSK